MLCAQGVGNNYETDLIFPIVAKAAQLAGVDYSTASPTVKTALKVGAAGRRAGGCSLSSWLMCWWLRLRRGRHQPRRQAGTSCFAHTLRSMQQQG